MKFVTIMTNERERIVSRSARRFFCIGSISLFLFSINAINAGTWTRLDNGAPGPVQLMLLLPDGTVMAANPGQSNAWYKLTPDIHGSYIHGTWTTLQPMNNTRLYYSSIVLPDGRVFVAGAEYGNGTATAEIYDPQADSWTMINPPAAILDPTKNEGFVDSAAVLLSSGKILMDPVRKNYPGQTVLYDPASNTWSNGGTELVNTENEATWLKLPDDTILTVDPGSLAAERYVLSSNTWFRDGSMTNTLWSNLGGEIGPALLMPDGRAFFIGADGLTAYYQPSLTPNPTQGQWNAGPNVPNVIDNHHANDGSVDGTNTFSGAAPDAPAAMLTNGHVLCVLSRSLYNDPRGGTNISPYWQARPNPQYPDPTSFFEFNPNNDVFTQIPSPTNPGTANSTDPISTYQAAMLVLPDGNVLYAHQGTDTHVYTPSGSPIPEGKPAITLIRSNSNGSYHIEGQRFNGISQGASYGDDLQMDSNYPIVRLTAQNGNVYFARTFFWNRNSVSTANDNVSTEFGLTGAPFDGGGGTYSLSVIANGNASNPITFAGPVWVDFTFTGNPKIGTLNNPYQTLADGTNAISAGGTLVLKGPQTTNETITNLSKPMTLIARGGAVTIGK